MNAQLYAVTNGFRRPADRFVSFCWKPLPFSRAVVVGILIVLLGSFTCIYGPGILDLFLLGAITLALFILPGSAILRLCSIDYYRRAMLALPVGLAVSTLVGYTSAFWGLGKVTLGCLVIWGLWEGGWRNATGWRRFLSGRPRSAGVFLIVTLCLLASIYGRHAADASFEADGTLFFQNVDSIFYCAMSEQHAYDQNIPAPNFALLPCNTHPLFYYLCGRTTVLTGINLLDVWSRWGRMLVLLSFAAAIHSYCRSVVRRPAFSILGLLWVITLGSPVAGYYALKFNLPAIFQGQLPQHYAFTFANYHLFCLYHLTSSLPAIAFLFVMIEVLSRSHKHSPNWFLSSLLAAATTYTHIAVGLMAIGTHAVALIWSLAQPKRGSRWAVAANGVLPLASFLVLLNVLHPISVYSPGFSLGLNFESHRPWLVQILLKENLAGLVGLLFAVKYGFEMRMHQRSRPFFWGLALVLIGLSVFLLSPVVMTMALNFLYPLALVLCASLALVFARFERPHWLKGAAIALFIAFWIAGYAGSAINDQVTLRYMSQRIPNYLVSALYKVRTLTSPGTIVMTRRYNLGNSREDSENSTIVSCLSGRPVLTEGSYAGFFKDKPLFTKVRRDNERFYSGVSSKDARRILDDYGVGFIVCEPDYPLPYDPAAIGTSAVSLGEGILGYKVHR